MTAMGDLRTACTTIVPLQALLGSGAAMRLWHEHAPQNATKPYVVFQVISGEGHRHMGGASAIRSPVVQFTVAGNDAAEADEVAEELFQGLHGKFDGVTVGGTSFRSISCDEPADLPVVPSDGAGAPRSGARMDARVWYS